MYPPVRGDGVAREEGYSGRSWQETEIEGVDVRILRRAVDEIVVVSWVKGRIIKEV